MGKVVADKNCEKIHLISDTIYCCGAGTAVRACVCLSVCLSFLIDPIFHTCVRVHMHIVLFVVRMIEGSLSSRTCVCVSFSLSRPTRSS